ncbi:MAG TPA: PspC domain-containing protein [Woeseiaceae bacterium]|nr:PspC domain-containing protein [Woeseiaceae bacterium]
MTKETLGPGIASGLYRDRENGWIFGVCAGIADYADIPVVVIRVIAVAGLLMFFWATVLTYAAATLLLREKPLTWSGQCQEHEFWCRRRSDDRWSHL